MRFMVHTMGNLPLKLNIWKADMGHMHIRIHFMISAICLLLMLLVRPASGQINFGDYVYDNDGNVLSGYEIELFVDQPLDFGFLFSNQTDPVSVDLTDDSQIGILEITAVRYMDVFVDVIPPDDLESFESGDRIPVNISYAYANRGVHSGPGSAITVPGMNVRFPIFQRASGQPPAPPPTPPHSGYTPPRETAFLYFFGTIFPDGGLNVGEYTGEIIITISYDGI